MKPLREWILDKLEKVAVAGSEHHSDYTRGYRDGCAEVLHSVLRELKAREDAEQKQKGDHDLDRLADRACAELKRELGVERDADADRVNENVNALDSLAGEVLNEKEGCPNDA